MKTHLFYTFLTIFVATALVTLLGVTEVIAIREGYLTALVGAFLIELAGAVIAIFKSANFFTTEPKSSSHQPDVSESIRKLDSAFGFLDRRIREQNLHFTSRLLAAGNLQPTPMTDTMVLLAMIEDTIGKLDSKVIEEALSTIVSLLESERSIGTHVRTKIISLLPKLAHEFAGPTARLRELTGDKSA